MSWQSKRSLQIILGGLTAVGLGYALYKIVGDRGPVALLAKGLAILGAAGFWAGVLLGIRGAILDSRSRSWRGVLFSLPALVILLWVVGCLIWLAGRPW